MTNMKKEAGISKFSVVIQNWTSDNNMHTKTASAFG